VPLAPKPFTAALALHGLYAHNLVGLVESYNDIRFGVNGGLGAFVAMGYIAPSFRTGLDFYFGRRFAINVGMLYIAASQILLNGELVATSGGTGFDVVLSVNY
jgi:hypothetical protein